MASLVICLPSVFNLVDMLLGPVAQGPDWFNEGLTKRGEGIFDHRGNDRVNDSANQPIALKPS
jgi:hypothetical protein